MPKHRVNRTHNRTHKRLLFRQIPTSPQTHHNQTLLQQKPPSTPTSTPPTHTSLPLLSPPLPLPLKSLHPPPHHHHHPPPLNSPPTPPAARPMNPSTHSSPAQCHAAKPLTLHSTAPLLAGTSTTYTGTANCVRAASTGVISGSA